MEFQSVNKLLEKSFRENWDRPALSNYKGQDLAYRDVARRIAKLHIAFEQCGLEKGDKVAICSRNQANWGVSFLAALTYGAVPVPILHEFKPGNIHYLVNHSEAKVLFVDDVIWENLSEAEMPGLYVVVQINNFNFLYSKTEEMSQVRQHLNESFGHKYPNNFGPENLDYYEDKADELAVINYTSGTHVHFLTRVPSPKIIMQAFADIKPHIIIAVPLIIEKVYKSKLKPILDRNKMIMNLPIIDKVIQKKILQELVNAFGGRFYEVIIGGAAFNPEVERFFHKIGFPFTVGYGMTECAPIIGYADWKDAKLYSCGKQVLNMEIRIDSPDPQNIPGEVLVKGANVFLGYYKNEEATKSVLGEDGWFHTGDMGVMDSDGYLFLKGRSKCMILGPSGQNIYPEEIEGVVNNVTYVVDSLVIEDHGTLVSLIYPDYHQAELDGLSKSQLEAKLLETLPEINKQIPNYAKISKMEFMPEDFERTPKRSIKRYLYQRN